LRWTNKVVTGITAWPPGRRAAGAPGRAPQDFEHQGTHELVAKDFVYA